MVKIVGCCHPKARSEGYVGPQLTKSRMEASWRSVRGRPILDNHNWRRQVGQVLDVWMDGEDQLWILAEVDDSTSTGAEVAQRIRSGHYQGLSLGMQHGVVKNTAASADRGPEEGWEGVSEVSWSEITEVSVCERGKYPNTILTSHFSKNPAGGPPTTSDGPGVLLSLSTMPEGRKSGGRDHTPAGSAPVSDKRGSRASKKNRTVFGSLLNPFRPGFTTNKMSDQGASATTTTQAPPAAAPTTTAEAQAAQQQQAAGGVPMQTEAPKEGAPDAGKDASEKAEDAKKDTSSDAHKLAMFQLKLQEMKKTHATEVAEAKKVAAQLAKTQRELEAFSSSARDAVGVGSREEFERMAEQKRSEMRKAAHTKAQDLLSTMYEWVNEAESPAGKAAISSLAANIQGFVGANKEVLDDNKLLAEIMGSTEVLHTAKAWADKRVSAERSKTAEVQKQFTEAQASLKAQQAQHAAVEKELLTAKRQLELIATSKAAEVPPAMQTGGIVGNMGFDNSARRTTLNSMASTNPAKAQAQTGSSTVFGSLLGGLVNPGEKRKFADTKAPAGATTTTTTTATLTTQASGNAPPATKRARTSSVYLFEVPENSIGFDRVGGSLGSNNASKSAMPGELRSLALGVGQQFRAQGGITRSLLMNVERFGGVGAQTSTPPHMRQQQQRQSSGYYGN